MRVANMVRITLREEKKRRAVAEATVYTKERVINMIKEGNLEKGEPFGLATAAGMNSAKKLPEIIPLCHHIPIDWIDIRFELKDNFLRIEAEVEAEAKTGVEMEALAAATYAALTLYDMCKPHDPQITISNIRIKKKEKDV